MDNEKGCKLNIHYPIILLWIYRQTECFINNYLYLGQIY